MTENQIIRIRKLKLEVDKLKLKLLEQEDYYKDIIRGFKLKNENK